MTPFTASGLSLQIEAVAASASVIKSGLSADENNSVPPAAFDCEKYGSQIHAASHWPATKAFPDS